MFKNIGPIKDAEFELGDLTIIAGQNNTGKTYLVYTLYSFLDILTNKTFPGLYHYSSDAEFSEKTGKIASEIKNHQKTSIQFEELKVLEKLALRCSSVSFSSRLINQVFSSPNGEFENAKFSIEEEMNGAVYNDAVYKIEHLLGRMVLTLSGKSGILTFECKNVEKQTPAKKNYQSTNI